MSKKKNELIALAKEISEDKHPRITHNELLQIVKLLGFRDITKDQEKYRKREKNTGPLSYTTTTWRHPQLEPKYQILLKRGSYSFAVSHEALDRISISIKALVAFNQQCGIDIFAKLAQGAPEVVEQREIMQLLGLDMQENIDTGRRM